MGTVSEETGIADPLESSDSRATIVPPHCEVKRAPSFGGPVNIHVADAACYSDCMRLFEAEHPHSTRTPAYDTQSVASILAAPGHIHIVSLVDALIAHAHDMRASDIHIEPSERSVAIRMRIDGALVVSHEFPIRILPEVISRIKVLADLRTDEHNAAQDGRFRIHIHEEVQIDIRVSIVPTYFGENAVLRLLTPMRTGCSLQSLGMTDHDVDRVTSVLSRQHGMILATGPTGSGKTTTLYTILKKVHKPDISIVTIEDPIEYAVPGITQINVTPRTGLTFAHGLRSLLRQDPNIIMVGEIRDTETASIAINTALTGHRVLTSLHTNDAPTTLPRLLDMGVDAYLVASTVSLAIGQRLVRQVCVHCAYSYTLSDAERESIRTTLTQHALSVESNLLDRTWMKGRGCERCSDTGFKGRTGVYEVMEVTHEVRDAIMRRVSAHELRAIAISGGMTTILDDGLAKAQAGITTLTEVLRIAKE